MMKFYEEFSSIEKVATLSQQLTLWHFVELIAIKDNLKREFYLAIYNAEKNMRK